MNHNVLLIEKGTNESVVYAHHDALNQPNDLAMAPNGTLYASDPNWADSTGKLWKVDDKGFHLLEENMGTTNGIEVSPDVEGYRELCQLERNYGGQETCKGNEP